MKRDGPIFFGFLGVLAWMPIPLGSNRDWAWLAAAAVLIGLAAGLSRLIQSGRLARSEALGNSRPALALLAVWLGFGVLQWIPLPAAVVQVLSPASVWPQPTAWWGGWASLSVDPYRSVLTSVQSAALACAFVLTLQLVRDRRRLTLLIAVMVVSGVLQAVYGGFMTLSGIEWSVLAPKTFNRGLATGTFVNRNHLAGFLVLCIAVAIGFLLGQMRQRTVHRAWRQRIRDWARLGLGPKMRWRLAVVLMVIGLVLTHSRMGNASLFIALLASAGAGLFLLRRAPRPMLVLVASLLVIDLVVIGTWFGVEQVVDRIQTTGAWDPSQQRYADSDRLDVDQEVLRAWADFRWLGSGGGSFATVFPAYRSADLSRAFDHAHNDFLEFLLEYGLIGCLPLASFWIWCVLSALAAQRRRHDPLMRGLGFGVGLAALAAALHGTVDFNLHIPAYSVYLMTVMALGPIAAHLRVGRRVRAHRAPGREARPEGVDTPLERHRHWAMMHRFFCGQTGRLQRSIGTLDLNASWSRLGRVAVIGLLGISAAVAQDSGVRIGDTVINPSLGLTLGYDDNITLRDDQRLSSWFYLISPAVRWQGGNGRQSLSLTYGLDHADYQDSDFDDYTDHHLEGEWVYDPTARSVLGLSGRYDRGHDGRGEGLREFDTEILARDVDRFRQTGMGAFYRYGADGARGQLEVNGGIGKKRYLNNADLTGIGNYSNRDLGAAFSWRVAPKTRLIVDGGIRDVDYDLDLRDNEERHIGIGASWEATAKTDGRVSVRYLDKAFDDGSPGYQGEAWEAALRWSPRTYSVLELSTARATDESFGASTFVVRETVDLTWRHEWRPRFATFLDAGLEDDRFDPGGRADDLQYYGLGFSYVPRHWLNVGFSYRYSDRESSISAFGYDRSLFLLSFEIVP